MKWLGLFAGVLMAVWIHTDGLRYLPLSDLEAPHLVAIPPRSPYALTGSEFARFTAPLTEQERQQAALQELLSGNIPNFLRQLKPVTMSALTGEGDATNATIWVIPDYLAIGSDKDFLRIPLSFPIATEVARVFGCVLPTRTMVDAIYTQSDYHLNPQPLPAGPHMRSINYFMTHQRKIEAQRLGRPLGELISGHKKDIVLTNRLTTRPNRIAIYGWHRLNGEPIQPLSTVHGARYADYSHGVRLISQNIWIAGKSYSIFDVLADPAYATLLTDEGLMVHARQLLMPRSG